MDNPECPQFSPAEMNLVLAELESMRDALAQLSLALSDYQFFIASKSPGQVALEVEVEVEKTLSRIIAATRRTQ